MSKDKKPQAGEWWFANDGSGRVYALCVSTKNCIVFEFESGTIGYMEHSSCPDHDWSDWHHEPRCTGWDWQPEPEPEWFDLTPHDGHVLRKDIDWFVNCFDEWSQIYSSAGMTINKYQIDNSKTNFRCLLKDSPPELLKPVESPDVCPIAGLPERSMKAIVGELRRGLPPIPEPKPATQREVLLYWYDGNVVGRYADCPPTEQSFVPLILRDGKVFIETETREVGGERTI